MDDLLEYRAGPTALQRVRDGMLQAHGPDVMIGAASGPKWLVAGGVDRALLSEGLLQRDRVLLAGASAGSWRMLALSMRDPHAGYAALTEAYVDKAFTKADSPAVISDSYRRTLAQLWPEAEVDHMLRHPHHELVVCAVRGRGPVASDRRWAQSLALGAAAVANVASTATGAAFFEQTLFHTSGAELFMSGAGEGATRRALSAANLRDVALASGTVPLYMAPITGVDSAPGRYIDGGMRDYHVRRGYRCERSVALFFSHEARIIPGWFDKFVPWRTPTPGALDDLLHIYPSAAFMAQLPDGRVPDRDDFMRFEHQPAERIARWRTAVALAERLGEQLREDLTTGGLQRKVRPL